MCTILAVSSILQLVKHSRWQTSLEDGAVGTLGHDRDLAGLFILHNSCHHLALRREVVKLDIFILLDFAHDFDPQVGGVSADKLCDA